MNYIKEGKNVINAEIQGVQYLQENLNDSFSQVIKIIKKTKNNQGHVIITGIGKSGIIGKKISSTMASLGIPSFFLHPSEAVHGDLGQIIKNDLILIISNSGNTIELVNLIPSFKKIGVKTILISGNMNSKLSKTCDYVLNIGNFEEADENHLAPTTSTTATLVLGDALAIVLSKSIGFTPEDFARFHPGGSLGQQLNRQAHKKRFM